MTTPDLSLRGPYPQNKKNLYYSFDCDENLHIYVKSKLKWGSGHEFFFCFLHRKPVIDRNRKKGSPR